MNVTTQEAIYEIPETLGGIVVREVEFSISNDLPIESLMIGKNVRRIQFNTALALSKLRNVEVDFDNPYLYENNNIVYFQNGEVCLVPIFTEELYVNNQIILSGPFRDLIHLKSLTIGRRVEEIKFESFINAYELESITFESGSRLSLIGDDAFANAISLIEIDLPISLQYLGTGILRNASSLVSLRAPFIGEERETTDELFRSHDLLVYFFGSKTYLYFDLIPSSLKHVEFYDISRIHNTTFYEASSLESIVLPDTMTHLGVRSFFATKNLVEFIVPNGITVIPEYAFEGSGIQEIIIPASVTYIADYAFKDTELTQVTYLGNLENLEISPVGNQSLLDLINP